MEHHFYISEPNIVPWSQGITLMSIKERPDEH